MKRTSIALLVASFMMAGCSLTAPSTSTNTATNAAVMQPQSQPFAERTDVQRGQLANGMKYVVAPNKQDGEKVSVQLIIHSGSLDEADDQLGIAHLVEHMAFNGTKDFPNNSMIDHQESLGMVFGRDVNAMTEQHSTSYYFHLPNSSDKMLDSAFHMLSQQAFAQVFDQQELESERPVVEEEWRGMQGMIVRLGTSVREIMLGDSHFAERNPIGDMDLVRHVGADRIKAFWETWYHPNNMTLVIVGDIEQSQVTPLLDKYFAPQPAKPLPERTYLQEKLDFPTALTVAHVADPEIVTEVVSINFRGHQAAALTPETLKAEMLNTLAMDMLRKRFGEMYQTEGEYISRIVAGDQGLVPDVNNNRIMAVVKDKDYDKAYTELFNHVSMFKAHGFTEADLIVAKADTEQFFKKTIQSLEKPTNSQVLNGLFGQIRLDHPLIDLAVKSKAGEEILNSITLAEVNQAFAQMIATRSPVAVTQLAKKNEPQLPSAEKVTQLWQQALANPPAMDYQEVQVKPLFTKTLTPVEPISTQVIDGTHIWHYPNGASVWFKPAAKTKNKLSLSWQGVGGTQHLLPNQLHAAQMAGRMMSRFGYGGLTEAELTMANAGKSMSVMGYIGELEHGVIGSTDAEDLEVWLQNMHLMMLEPQTNDEIWQSNKKMLLKGLSHEVISADRQFDEAVARIRYVNDPAYLPLSAKDVEPIEVSDMLAVWQQMFSSASGRKMVIVGDASAEQIKALMSRYVGNLPAGTPLAEAVMPKLWTGKHEVRINAGLDPKAATGLYFNIDQPYSLNVERQAALVSRIVRMRLMTALREEAGGTYAPSFGIKLDRERQQLYGNLSYGHQPERTEEMFSIAKAVLDKLSKEGITQAELDEVKQQQRIAYHDDNISDKLRFGWLRNAARENQVIDDQASYLQWLDTVQVHDMNSLLTKFFNSPNVIDARMGPAKK